MKKIKVLHITQATIGGTLEYLKLFFSNIDKNTYEIYLICPSYGPMKKEIMDMGVKVYPVEMSREINIKYDFNAFIKIKKTIKEINPDIVHLHSSKAGVLGKLASFINKKPCVYNAHGWSFSMNVSDKKKKIYALIERYTSIFCNVIVNISEYEYNLAKEYNIADDKKMITIYNGIDIEKYNKKKYCKEDIIKKLDIPNDSFIVGMVARISEQKDPIKFVNIAKEVCKSIDNAYFLLVGDGELREKVEKLIIDYGLEKNFKITGWVNDVNKYISIFDVAILTSRWEGFGLVLTEYMAASKPIIASNVGGIPELIDNGKNGILVNVDDFNKYVESILYIISNEDKRDMYVRNSNKILKEKFNIKEVIKRHDLLYKKLIFK